MPSITQQLDAAFRTAIQAAFGFDADPVITVSANPQFGDYQSNAAMGLTKRVAESTGGKVNPRQIAEQIKAKLSLGRLRNRRLDRRAGVYQCEAESGVISLRN